MIRRAETDADFALCASIKNAVQPGEPVTATELRDDPSGRLFLSGEAGYAVVKESSLAGCAFTMVRVLPGARRRGIGSGLLAVCSDEAPSARARGALWPGRRRRRRVPGLRPASRLRRDRTRGRADP